MHAGGAAERGVGMHAGACWKGFLMRAGACEQRGTHVSAEACRSPAILREQTGPANTPPQVRPQGALRRARCRMRADRYRNVREERAGAEKAARSKLRSQTQAVRRCKADSVVDRRKRTGRPSPPPPFHAPTVPWVFYG